MYNNKTKIIEIKKLNKKHYYWPYKNKTDCKGILWTTICQHIRLSWQMGKFLERHKLSKLVQEKNFKYELTNDKGRD